MWRRCKSVKERDLSSEEKRPDNNAKKDNTLTQLVQANQKKREAAFDAFCDALLEKATRKKYKG